MRFFKSKDVKIFPCSNRGTYTESRKDLVFDPESRRASEYNFTHLSGRDLGKDSYVIDYDDTNKLLKVVLGGYYFEIYTESSGLTFAQPNGSLYTYALNECTLWLTLQKIAISNATSADSARSTQQLASIFSRVLVSEKNYDYYATATEMTGELYHLTPEAADSEEGNTWWEIDPSCINLNTLDFPAIYRSDALTGSLSDQTPEYFCAAIGITSPGSAIPSLVINPEAGYYPIVSDAGEDLSGCLISLDLSKAENWLKNIAASEFLYKEGEPDWVECKKHFQVDQLKTTSQLETVGLKATGSSDLQAVTATTMQANVLKPNTGDDSTLDITATTISVGTISDVESLSAEAVVAETVTAETVAVPSMSDITITSTTPPTTLKAQVDGMISTADERVKAQLIGDTILRAENTTDPNNIIEAITIDEANLSIAGLYGKEKCEVIEGKTGANDEDWSDAIPHDLTLTGLKKDISRLTATGGEPNTIAELFVGDTKLSPNNKQVNLDQQLSIANLSDGARVTTIEETLNGTTPAEGDPTIGLVAKVNDLEVNIKNLDNIMNFRGLITPGDLVYLTNGCTGTLQDDSDLKGWASPITIEVGDVVIVRSKQDTDQFDYSDSSYYNNTEFICTAVTEGSTTWQEIGNCDITDSLIREIIGDDIDSPRTGTIKERLCAAEDLIAEMQDESTAGTISYRIAAMEDAIGNNEDTEPSVKARITSIEKSLGELSEDSTVEDRLADLEEAVGTYSVDHDPIGDRLDALETLTAEDGDILAAIGDNAKDIKGILAQIGEDGTETSITARLKAVENDIGTDNTPDSILARLAGIETDLATLDGALNGGTSGDEAGEANASITSKVATLEGKVTTIENSIGADDKTGTLYGRLKVVENSFDSYVLSSDFEETLAKYTNTTDLNGLLEAKVATTYLESNYTNNTELAKQFANYTPKSELETTFAKYTTTSDLNTIIGAEESPTETSIRGRLDTVESRFNSYTTTDDLTTQLANKISNTTFNTIIGTENPKEGTTILGRLDTLEANDFIVNGNVENFKSEIKSAIVADSGFKAEVKGATGNGITGVLATDTATGKSITITTNDDSIGAQFDLTLIVEESKIASAVNTYLGANLSLVVLSFDLNGVSGSPIAPMFAIAGTDTVLPTLPLDIEIPDNLMFGGWHTARDSAQAFTTVAAPAQNTMYYAVWHANQATE